MLGPANLDANLAQPQTFRVRFSKKLRVVSPVVCLGHVNTWLVSRTRISSFLLNNATGAVATRPVRLGGTVFWHAARVPRALFSKKLEIRVRECNHCTCGMPRPPLTPHLAFNSSLQAKWVEPTPRHACRETGRTPPKSRGDPAPVALLISRTSC